ncbi:Acyl-CoA dehydrogenase [Nitrosococcus oceani ATCC 19707]|uniref:Acyl-CoA dehydrogenase n=2 Tax=Nitrosococcus oceani TaxID=1229 RepID=Q3JAV8_NITOC|nr:acyl-CoA dehydrogenase family protein [Nitrosococcus oceani]ABA58038.1 Acyl-CoA dehydrogenase [Nitrosococcus oceani ATCC 19707]EDZ67277.1 Acyl-CoA dehydrogenase, C-terminal domain protein [Nitrosococcus oceani AFC27]KFI19509.1 acyl-CoA dehydrogenase [Nitrosococcus oceani C-27]GEM21001.1 acyl-CoA dehydrogenase [Nitrosococcus oceani]
MAKTPFGQLKDISEADREQIEAAQEMLGPEPETMGFVKNLFWGHFREELLFPFPEVSLEEASRCDQLLTELDEYLRNEHPAIAIDQEQKIPASVVKRLFNMGIMGMIVPKKYGGGGFGITSYNRVLSRIGQRCGSTAVMVSAHQSIGCGAIILFGTDAQKKRFLPAMAQDHLSAFCLSEPNVGSDASGQETRCKLSEDGQFYILNGEKKWASSAALSGLFTVLAKQKIQDPRTGKEKDQVTALICTPDMAGIDIYSRNRSKCGIRGTWQARIRFRDVKVPRENLLHQEGKGLNVALTCLDYGRCTLAAGMVGAAATAYEQAVKWAQYRYQFGRPLADFEQIQAKIASMAANCYAMEAMLYMTTGMLDRHDEDIMLETGICKVFCSEIGYRVVDDALQIMGGESYMTENEVERLWRDSRINLIVEGANEVMLSFIFGYGSKQLGEALLNIAKNPMKHLGQALRISAELFLGIKKQRPRITRLHPSLAPLQGKLENYTQQLSHETKRMFHKHREKLITRQMLQARLSWAAIWIHAMSCSLSYLDRALRLEKKREQIDSQTALVEHFFNLASRAIEQNFQALKNNADDTLPAAAKAALRYAHQLPNAHYVLPEKTPIKGARGTGRQPDQTHIQQFGSGWLTL